MPLPSPHSALTAHQEKVFRYLEAQHAATGLMPSAREVQAHFGFSSLSQVTTVQRRLEQKGFLKRFPRKARGLLLASHRAEKTAKAVSVPILGTIPAGFPVDTTENVLGHLQVDGRLFGSAPLAMIFGLRVCGDSMIEAGIYDGDYAFCESTESREPRPRDIVAALIDGGTTLKRYLLLEGSPCLKAENPQYPDLIPARELVIQGVFVALLRGAYNLLDD